MFLVPTLDVALRGTTHKDLPTLFLSDLPERQWRAVEAVRGIAESVPLLSRDQEAGKRIFCTGPCAGGRGVPIRSFCFLHNGSRFCSFCSF